jgi:hypothetical protein
MGWEVLHDREKNMATLFCNTVDRCLGPVVYGGDEDAGELLEAFVEQLDVDDPRRLGGPALRAAYGEWLDAREVTQ